MPSDSSSEISSGSSRALENPDTADAHASGDANPSMSMSTTPTAGMSYARALIDARTLIVQQSARIKADAQKMKAQSEEIAQLRSSVDAMAVEADRLRALEPRLGEATAGREQAEALVGRQRVEIESLETASRELQRMLGEQAARINELTTEIGQLRANLPTDEDAAALEQMAALLTNARAKSRQRAEAQGTAPVAVPVAAAVPGRLDRNIGLAMAREHHQREAAGARSQAITIPAEPTPFCIVSARQAA